MPDPKPRRRRRWLRRILGVLVVGLFAAVIAAIVTVQNLEWIAKWSIHRVFPGVKADFGSLRAVSPTRLEVRELTLESAKTGEPLLSLEGGSAHFRFGDILRLHLEELHLQRPNLVVSPDLGEALGVESAGSAERAKPGWGIGRLVVTDGHLTITRFGERSPTLDLDFSADFHDFGVGDPAGALEHSARLENITATDSSDRRLLEIAEAAIRFTTGELFVENRLRSARIGEGTLEVVPGLLETVSAPPAATGTAAAEPGETSSGWTVDALSLEGLTVTIPNAPGVIGRIDFRITADLQGIGSADADALQRVRVEGLHVATDRNPSAAMISASAASAQFTLAGLKERRIEELLLEEPVIDLAPADLAEAQPAAPRSTAANAGSAPLEWLIRRTVSKYGVLRVRGLREGALDVAAKFAFDLADLGTGGGFGNKLHDISVWDVQAAAPDAEEPMATFDVVQVRFSPLGLLERRHIEAVGVTRGRLVVGATLQGLLADEADAPGAQAESEDGWSIGSLDISGVRTRIEDTRPGLTEISFTLNTSLRDVKASGAASQLLGAEQTVELANISLRSPLDPDARILTLRSVFVSFTLRDLARKHLSKVVILRPTIFLSRDLFVYMERAAAGLDGGGDAAAPAADPDERNWSVDLLEVKFGQLVIGSGGKSDVGLPLEFETTAENLALDNLAALELQTVLRVPKQSRDFPDYQISLEGMEGDLRFAYPPEKGQKNLVQKLDIAGVRWRQYRARQAWVAVTFDAAGINGQFGGAAYEGYLNGGFSFFFQSDSPWIGWVAGTGVDTKSLTDVISPQNFGMSGPLDFEIQLDAFRKNIDRVRGVFHLAEPGRLKIGKLDDMLANIPPEWPALKQSSMRIALETLRDFDYTAASGDFWFVQSQGILNLDLSGPHGSRRFEAALHDGQENKNLWQQGKLGIGQASR